MYECQMRLQNIYNILDLARYYDETEIYKRNQICRKIKEKLQDKIKEGKITERWIEESLSQKHKRRHTKSEVSSVSIENKEGQVLSIIAQEAESCAIREFADDHKPTANPSIKRSSQEVYWSWLAWY